METSTSVSDYFSTTMELDVLIENDKRRILNTVFNYLLGIEEYTETVRCLKELGFHRSFSQALKSMPIDYISYIIRLRKSAKKKKIPKFISANDKHYLLGFNSKFWKTRIGTSLDLSSVAIPDKVPSFEYAYTKYRPLVVNLAQSISYNNSWDNGTGFEDICSILYYTLYQKYITYVFNIGVNKFNTKVFFAMIIQGLRSKKIDIIRKFCKKNNICKSCVSFDELQELGCI